MRDQYQIAPGNELPGNFIYDNTYLVYKDASGATVAEIIYVQCSIGNATTEKKIIRKGNPALTASTLTIAPNPAQKNINISFRTEEKASQVLNISTPEGKVVKTLIDQQPAYMPSIIRWTSHPVFISSAFIPVKPCR